MTLRVVCKLQRGQRQRSTLSPRGPCVREAASAASARSTENPAAPADASLQEEPSIRAAGKDAEEGASLAVQWLRLHASTAGVAGSIIGRGTKIPREAGCSQKVKNK